MKKLVVLMSVALLAACGDAPKPPNVATPDPATAAKESTPSTPSTATPAAPEAPKAPAAPAAPAAPTAPKK